jgi:hypothetical protein
VSRNPAFRVAALVCAVFVVALVGCTAPSAPAAGAAISVDAGEQIGVMRTRLGTQFVWPGGLDRAPATRGLFKALAPSLVRINATTIGADPVLPAGIRKGDWSFDSLNSIVNDARAAGSDILLTVAYAPEWMWDCAKGTLRDAGFAEFGDYMARLVGYFNRGAFVAEDGRTIVNPGGQANRIAYWELWNEPDQLKGCPPNGNRITVSQYVAMWNAAAAKMLAVDPTIKLVGPATSQAGVADYVPALLTGAAHKPDIISFHGYGGWLNSQTDRFLFEGDGTSFGLRGIERVVARVRTWAPGIPVWISELNVNAAFDESPSAERAWNAFGAAWGASAFRTLALSGADAVFQYQFAHPDLRQFSLVDARTGDPLLPYWRDYLLARYFPPGTTLVRSTSNVPGVETLAGRPPGSRAVHVLVVNRQVDGETTVDGPGRATTLPIEIKNAQGPTINARVLDASTSAEAAPPVLGLTGTQTTISFSGYGAVLLAVSDGSSVAPDHAGEYVRR